MPKKLITIIIAVSLVLPPVTQVAQAGVLDSTIGFSSCTAAGFISNLVADGLTDLENIMKNKIKNWLIRKRIIRIPSGRVPGLFNPVDSRVPVEDKDTKEAVDDFKGAYTGKEHVQDLVARCAAREILTALGRNIMDVVRTGGRDSGPAWVRNWRNFRLGAQYRGENIFKAMLASTNTCEYFGNDVKGLFGANQKAALTRIKTRASNNDSYQVRAGCTLPGDFDFAEYKNDFSGQGGWEAWSRLMEPQNNYYGSLFMALDEQSAQRSLEEQADIDEAGQTGFTAIRGRTAADNCAVRSPYQGGLTNCLIYKDILTPSGVLSGAVVAGIESELQWVASTDEFNEIIASALQILINRLWDLSNADEGEYVVPGNVGSTIDPFLPDPSSPGLDPITSCIQSCEQTFCVDPFGSYDPTCQNADQNSFNACIEECLTGGGTQPNIFGQITVNFDIVNNNDGSATADDFQLFIDGELTAIGLARVLPVGEYVVTSGAPTGYTLVGITGACDGDGSFTLSEGGNLVCTVTYDDI